jgi:VCBS repeat-containing protein
VAITNAKPFGAADDIGSVNEDAAINMAVLTNDVPAGTPKTTHYSLAQSGTTVTTKATSKLGATITINTNGTVNYNPTGVPAIQALAPGETAADTFADTISIPATFLRVTVVAN